MMYSFDIEIAKKHGVEAAVLIHNIGFWLKKNIANRSNIYDGFVWTFNTSESFEELFPFWSGNKIARMLRDLENEGVLKSGNYNKIKFDRTKWYTIADTSIVQIYELHCANLNNGLLKNEQSDYSEMNNGLFINEQPIPYSKLTDSKQDSKQSCDAEKSAKTKKFIAPSVEEVAEYCAERKNNVSAQKFVDFYEARGWMAGKAKMKDWKAGVRTWESNSQNSQPVQQQTVFKIGSDF